MMKKPIFNLVWLFLIVYSLQVNGGKLGPLTYGIADGQATITDCDEGAKGELEIPAEIEGAPVTSIRNFAFRDCSSLSSVTIPDSVTSIGSKAFYSCSALTSIIISESVTSIWDNTFRDCSSLSSITIPDSVTSIGSYAFLNCSSLTSIIIPESVTIIGGGAFSMCSSLTSIIIPESVTIIGNGAFSSRYSSLTSIVIPQAFHSQQKAGNLALGHLWPDGFFLPSSITRTPKLSIRMPLQLMLTGEQNTEAVIEATDTLTGPWTEWETVVIGEDGTTEVDLDEGAEQRFYRIRR